MLRGRKLIVLIIFCLSFSLAPFVQATPTTASLYLSPSTGSYTVGNNFSIDLKVNSGGVAINAAQGSLVFSPDELSVVGLSKSGSIFTLWTTEPAFSNSEGVVSFAAGLPNPGFSGAAGKIITVTFKAKKEGQTKIAFSSGAILANDGRGTNVLSSIGSGNYTIISRSGQIEVVKPPAEEQAAAETSGVKPRIISSTHLDQNSWYAEKNVSFSWDLPYGTEGVSISFNNKSQADPGSFSDGLFSAKDYADINDGVWYLHLKLRSSIGWSQTDNFRVQIDSTPPEPFKIAVEKQKDSGWPLLSFKTEDKISGVDYYEVKIDEQEFKISAAEARLQVPALNIGAHTVLVKAIDRAGNKTLALEDFVIEPIEAPVISNYPAEITTSRQLIVGGTALANVKINVFLLREGGDQFASQSGQSDENGHWFLKYQGKLKAGKYSIWAEAVNAEGVRSRGSNRVGIVVIRPLFIEAIWWIIRFIIALAGLLILALLLIILFLHLTVLIIKRIGRLEEETGKIDVILEENLESLKKFIEKELILLGRVTSEEEYRRERIKIKTEIKNKIEKTKEDSKKEIRKLVLFNELRGKEAWTEERNKIRAEVKNKINQTKNKVSEEIEYLRDLFR